MAAHGAGSQVRGQPARRGPEGYVIAVERRRRPLSPAASSRATPLLAPASPRVLRALIAAADGLREFLAIRSDRSWTPRDLTRTGTELADLVRRYQAASRQVLQEWLERPRYGAWLADSCSGRVFDILDGIEASPSIRGIEVQLTAAGDQTAHGLWRRHHRPGIGIPVVVWTRRSGPHQVKRLARFSAAQPRTAVIIVEPDFDRRVRSVRIELVDPISSTTVALGGASLPLAADFTAPVALTLGRERRPVQSAYGLRELARRGTVHGFVALTPFSPDLSPLILVESAGLPPLLMAQIANEVAGTPELRQRYQAWLYRLPPSAPLFYCASRLRADLERFGTRLRSTSGREAHATLVAHGVGAAVARSLVVPSQSALSDGVFRTPVDALRVESRDRAILESLLSWNVCPHVERVIALGEPGNRAALVAGVGARAVQLLLRQPKGLRESVERILGSTRQHLHPIPEDVGAADGTEPREPFFDDPVCRAIAGVAVAADRALLALIGAPSTAAAALFAGSDGRRAAASLAPTGHDGYSDPRIVTGLLDWLRSPG